MRRLSTRWHAGFSLMRRRECRRATEDGGQCMDFDEPHSAWISFAAGPAGMYLVHRQGRQQSAIGTGVSDRPVRRTQPTLSLLFHRALDLHRVLDRFIARLL